MAIQFVPLIAAIVGGAVTVGAGAYAYKSYQDSQPQQEPSALIQPTENPSIAPTPRPDPAKKPEVAGDQPKLPEFHLLRAEDDGSVVVAGSAQPLGTVEILHNNKALAKSKAASNGDFAIVFDDPLKPGTYELFIRSTLKDSVLLSAEAGIIHIPENGEEVIAMVSQPGEASKLIQVPTDPQEQVPVKPAKTPKPEEKKKTTIAKIVKNVEEITKPAEVKASEPAKSPEPVIVAKTPVPVKPVLLGAVEVEGDKMFIAGTGEPGRIINLYMDDKFVGGAKVNSQGAFLLESNSKLVPGKHTVRADMLATKNAVVVARAQVPLIHDAPVVEVAKVATQEKPAPVIVAKAPDPVEKPAPIVIAKAPEVEEKPEPVVIAKAPVSVVKPAPVTKPQPARNLGAVEIKKPESIITTPKPDTKVAVAEQTRVIRTGSSVIIRRGDNLWHVSRRILGRGIRYSTIYNANRSQIRDPNLIFPGQVFKIPEKMVGNNTGQNG